MQIFYLFKVQDKNFGVFVKFANKNVNFIYILLSNQIYM